MIGDSLQNVRHILNRHLLNKAAFSNTIFQTFFLMAGQVIFGFRAKWGHQSEISLTPFYYIKIGVYTCN